MKCERCGQREATYHYRENINGKETKAHLCSVCAAEKEVNIPMLEFFSGGIMGQILSNTRKSEDIARKIKKCSLCGSELSFLEKTGKVGCPQCYIDFAPYLENALGKIHGNTVHKGKSPAGSKKQLDMKRRKMQLEAELREAVEAEEYERAAVIRDRLRTFDEDM